MAVAKPIDQDVMFENVVAVTRMAPAATVGWRATCVWAQRAVGTTVLQPLSELDLGEEIPSRPMVPRP